MGEEVERGEGAVMCGALTESVVSPVPASALPPTRRLEAADIARVDEEEGLRGNAPDGTPSRCSVGGILLALVGVAVIVCLCVCVFPMSRLGHGKLSASPTFTASLAEGSKGGLSRLAAQSDVDKVLQEVERLRAEHRYADAAKFCQSTLNGLEPTWSVHKDWERVWGVYLETLRGTRRRRDLFRACTRLAAINPDSDVCVYYRIQYWLDKIAGANDQIKAEDRELYDSVLKAAENDCLLRTKGQGDPSAFFGGEPGLRERHFLLLLGEVRLQSWVLNGRPLDDAGQECFSEVLESLAQIKNDVRSVRLELRAWRECGKAFTFWNSWKIGKGVVIDGMPIDRQSVDRRIDELQRRLKEGTNR